MDAALYHPEHGYYCRPGATTGPQGDYYTSSDLHSAFGRLLARQISEIAQRTSEDSRDPFHVVEAGPGTGRLARDIVAGLFAEDPGLARRVRYTLVEVSPSLRRVQERTLAGEKRAAELSDLSWMSWPALLGEWGRKQGGFRGCVLANEFLDALPVHLVQMEDERLMEVHVDSDGEGFGERLGPPSTDRLAGHLRALEVDLAPGQRAEIGLRALDWVSSLEDLFGSEGRGGAILIDYGHPARELYDAARQGGTLLCYYRHRAVDDPYVRVGQQDMTAHVDFTSITRRARAAGFDTAPIVTQLKFLVSLGLARMLAELAAAPEAGAAGLRERIALHGLMAPGGMGEVFKVVLLARGTEASGLTGAVDPFRAGRGARPDELAYH